MYEQLLHIVLIDWLDKIGVHAGVLCLLNELGFLVGSHATDERLVLLSHAFLSKQVPNQFARSGSIDHWHAEVHKDQLVDRLACCETILD